MRLLALLFLAAILLACTGDDDDSPARSPAASTAASPTAVAEVTETATTRPAPQSTTTPGPPPFPTPTWSEPDEAFLEAEGPYNSVILDTETGELITLNKEPVRGFSGGALSVLAWSPDGGMVIGTVGLSPNRNQLHNVFLGPPGGPWETIELDPFHNVTYADFSPDGSLLTVRVQTLNGPRTYEVNTATGVVVASANTSGLIQSYSFDRRFRIELVPASTQNRFEARDLVTGESFEFDGFSGAWSPVANVFAYTREVAEEPARAEVVLHNFDTGSEEALMEANFIHSWSPDGRYLVLGQSGIRQDDFLIVDLAQRGADVKVMGAWARGWLADGRLLYTRNICGDFDLYAISPDGSDDSPIVTGRPGAGMTAIVSPAGDRIVYRTFGEDGRLYVHPLDGSGEIAIEAGLFSPPYGPWTQGNWSPDGRYVVLYTPAGKDGPCMMETGPRPTTIEVFP